jgi:predicted metal-dependent phosphoesterase TrpH
VSGRVAQLAATKARKASEAGRWDLVLPRSSTGWRSSVVGSSFTRPMLSPAPRPDRAASPGRRATAATPRTSYPDEVRIDLHTHSYASDGTDSPADVVRQAAAAGLDVVALTDHDTTRGWAEAAAAAEETGIALVRGIEVSCSTSRGVSVHLLGYLPDPEHAALVDETEAARASRQDRARRLVDRVAQDFPLTWEDVLAQLGPDATVGRPHIADALVARGHVPDRAAAFAGVLASRGPYYVPYQAPDVVTMVRAIRAAGGVPVLAHPFAAARGRVVPRRVIEEMAEAGLAGLEVDHRDHTPENREQLRSLASRLGLVVTGSSDYHGAGKPNRLGENLTDPAVFEQIEAEGALPVVRA